MNPSAAEVAFRLEIVLLREDHRDEFTTTHAVEEHIRRVARSFKMPTWFIRGMVEEAWKPLVGEGKLCCTVCGRSYSSHPIGHCPTLGGEPVYQDAVSSRTLKRRESRARSRDRQSIPARGRA